MKACPECRFQFSRMKKGGCPSCGTPLFNSKGTLRRESDRTLAVEMREYVRPKLERNLGVGGYMMLLEEQVYAYRIIDALRAWLELQPLKVMTLEALIYAVIETMLQDKYWKTQMRSLSAVAKYAVRTAQDVYRTAKLEKDKEATQLRRILNANNNQLAVDYD